MKLFSLTLQKSSLLILICEALHALNSCLLPNHCPPTLTAVSISNCIELVPTSGPLHLLYPQPGLLYSHGQLFLVIQLKYHLLRRPLSTPLSDTTPPFLLSQLDLFFSKDLSYSEIILCIDSLSCLRSTCPLASILCVGSQASHVLRAFPTPAWCPAHTQC